MNDTFSITVGPVVFGRAGRAGDFTGRANLPCWSIEGALNLAAARVLKCATLRVGADVWSTASSIPPSPGDDAQGRGELWPLVLFENGIQLNRAYGNMHTFLPGPRVITFYAACSIQRQLEGAALSLSFTDNTVLTAYAPVGTNVKAPNA